MPSRKAAPAPADVDNEPEGAEIDDLDEELDDLEDGDEDAVDLDVDDDDDDVVVVVEEEEEVVGEEVLTPEPAAVVDRSGEEGEEDEDEEPEDEDVEASLDVILKERLVVEDEPEDEEPADVEDRSEMTERVLPKQPDEFVCRSCFLVKHPSQLADKKKMLCRDCV